MLFLIAASLYSQYGAQPFKLDDIREMAESVGVTIPSQPRHDVETGAARREIALFQHTGRSEFKPTVHGELVFQEDLPGNKRD